MRTYSTTSTLIFSILSLYLLVSTTACEKTSDNPPAKGKLSFTYNGTQYNLPYDEKGWGIFNSGILIMRRDIFNGDLYFPNNNCAYLDPTRGVQMAANCQLAMSQGLPIDSVIVYWYQSGSVNITYKNCVYKSGYDPGPGGAGRVTYEVCDVDGRFDLILKNKEDKTIIITEGKLELYNYKK